VPGQAGPRVRTAVIGYGLAGRVFHAPLVAAADDLELVAVVTGDPVRQEQVRTYHPGAAVLASADELLQRADSFDLVVVAAPNDAHVALALAALQRG
jgi:scyllo-inositol 2-dehydrogenase (NADP+)